MAFRHEIETAQPMRAEGGRFRLAGWCLVLHGDRVPEIRLTGAPLHALAISRQARPDVIAALGADHSVAACGFVLEGGMPPGVHFLALEASIDGRHWLKQRELCVLSTPAELQVGIEWPAGPVVRESVRIQGWCAHPDFPVAEVWLHYGHRRLRCDYGLPRRDVPGFLPRSPDAGRAGFIAPMNIPAGHGPLRISAVTADGHRYIATPPTAIAIEYRDEIDPQPIDLSGTPLDLGPARRPVPAAPPPPLPAARAWRILFVLYGDFTSNSAIHVVQLANTLAAQGCECVVAVPHHVETVRYHPEARFRPVLFAECLENPAVFRDGRTAEIIHAWTSRENVRQLCEQLQLRAPARRVVHLEDHEAAILAATLGRPLPELLALSAPDLDRLILPVLSHPRRSRAFLESADAVTVIVDRLREFVPPGKPVEVVRPAADDTFFFTRPIPWPLRKSLGWDEQHTVLFYHGNVHAANQAEVAELYAAVARLNESGAPTTLIRTGRDFVGFPPDLAARTATAVIHLGQVDCQQHLPPLMALADYFVQPGAADTFNDYRFPSKLPEFFALGRPVVLPRTNLGEELRHGEDAWILPRADAESIAGAIRTLRQDHALVARLSEGARRVSARCFDWRRSAAALLRVYNSLPSPG